MNTIGITTKMARKVFITLIMISVASLVTDEIVGSKYIQFEIIESPSII